MWKILLLIIFSLAGPGCASTSPYVASEKHFIQTEPSVKHNFSYVRVQAVDSGNELMIYGKLSHPHQGCREDAQVILQSTNVEGKVVFSQGMTMRPQSNHQKGWSGAGFRDRISNDKISGTQLKLTIVDIPCRT